MGINSWPVLKVAQYCNAFIGRKTDRGKHLTGWGYGKVGRNWYEIFSKFTCGRRKKITSCEVIGKADMVCQVRKECGRVSKVKFTGVYVVPRYQKKVRLFSTTSTAPYTSSLCG